MLQTLQSSTLHAGFTREDESCVVESRMLINVVHHLLIILGNYLGSVVRGDTPVTATDWETFEALLGKDGKDSVWAARLFDLSMIEPESGTYMDRLLEERHSEDYGSKLREEIEIVRGCISVAKSGF